MLIQVRPSKDCVKPEMQPPQRTPERLPLHKGLVLGAFGSGGGKRHEGLSPHPQYPSGHLLASVRGLLAEVELRNFAQNPLETFTKVVQCAIPNGQPAAEGKRTHSSIDGKCIATSKGTIFEVREI